MILFFDTETTNLPNFRAKPDDPSQPHIVQLGAILCDPARKVVAELNLLVLPEGWTIAPEAQAIHGISPEQATRYGLRIATVARLFAQFVKRAELLVAHNISFDKLLVLAELLRLNEEQAAVEFQDKPTFCTMQATTPICKLPGKFDSYKWPKLTEAYRHLLGKELDCAHDAMADVRGCMEVYYALHPLAAPKETESLD